MPTTYDAQGVETSAPTTARRLYRSKEEKVVAGVCGGLGQYFGVDPIWFRIGFVLLALGGGSGVLIYLIMVLLIPSAPEGYQPEPGQFGRLPGSAIVGLVFMIGGSIVLVSTIAPWLGQYFWPVAFVVGGLALVVGGLIRDNDR